MNRLLPIILILLSPLYSQDNDGFGINKGKNILIVSDQDGLEWNVADYLEKHFNNDGYQADNILISEYTKSDHQQHSIVILMNVLKDNKIPLALQKKMELSGASVKNIKNTNQETIFFISTLSGEEWGPEKRMIDGITSASEMEDAEPIAKRIIDKIEAKLK